MRNKIISCFQFRRDQPERFPHDPAGPVSLHRDSDLLAGGKSNPQAGFPIFHHISNQNRRYIRFSPVVKAAKILIFLQRCEHGVRFHVLPCFRPAASVPAALSDFIDLSSEILFFTFISAGNSHPLPVFSVKNLKFSQY